MFLLTVILFMKKRKNGGTKFVESVDFFHYMHTFSMNFFPCSRLSVICLKSIIPHCPSKTPMWTDAKWTEKEAELTLCDKGIFTFPISWMGDTTQTLQGKLLCPKCQAKLGSFSWCKGLLMVLCNLLHRFLVSTWTKVLHLHILQDLSFFCKMAYAYEFSLHALFIFALCLHKARMLLHKSPLSHFSLVQNPNSQEF